MQIIFIMMRYIATIICWNLWYFLYKNIFYKLPVQSHLLQGTNIVWLLYCIYLANCFKAYTSPPVRASKFFLGNITCCPHLFFCICLKPMQIASNLELYWTLLLSEKTWARQSHRRQPTDSKQNSTRLQKRKEKEWQQIDWSEKFCGMDYGCRSAFL